MRNDEGVLGVGCWVLGKTAQNPIPNTQHPLLIHHSSLPRFGLLGGCKFSTKRSGVGNVRLAEGAASGAQRVVYETLGGGGEEAYERGVVRLECAEGTLFEHRLREAFLVEADERDAQGGRVGDDEPLAREPLVGA